MNIFLNPEQEEFIKTQIEKGKYTNALEVISAAFKVLEEKELQPDNSHQKKMEIR
ncbi:MAG: type II toxin-antitoxin system ParD family antitoxin [Brasilonema octagenarum HA4186-MV1]|jgi:antitoxin ParD1/3/4|nr:type II toxin-antitoxin system ParD family antitoxin [Brasilonema octagenarum HA4186-MV1]